LGGIPCVVADAKGYRHKYQRKDGSLRPNETWKNRGSTTYADSNAGPLYLKDLTHPAIQNVPDLDIAEVQPLWMPEDNTYFSLKSVDKYSYLQASFKAAVGGSMREQPMR